MGLKDDVLDIAMLLREAGDRLTRAAGMIPTREEFEQEVAAAAQHDDEHDDDHDTSDSSMKLNLGKKVGRRDRNSKKLRKGDLVRVTGSDRYGTATGIVTGPGPDYGDGKERVTISLENGMNDEYTPSVGRVERIGDIRVLQQNRASTDENGHSNGDEGSAVIEVLNLGVLRVGVMVPRALANEIIAGQTRS